jgi:hypothetical protein
VKVKGPEMVLVNITNKALDPAALLYLSKGLNYAQITCLKSNLKDIMGGVKRVIQHFPMERAEEIRQETCRIPGESKPRKTNTSQEDRDKLQALRNDMDIRVLIADKGNAMVVLLSEDYRSKISNIFSDPIYRKLTPDPTNKIVRRKTAIIKKSEITEEGVKRLKLHASKPPRLYGIPKIHKDVPLSLIVKCIGSLT